MAALALVSHLAHAMVTPTASFDSILSTAVNAAKEASVLIRDNAGADVVKSKANAKDLLTEIDTECQRVIERHVTAAHPSGHAFLGEESVEAGAKASAEALDAIMAASDAEYLWIVDPIDGTTNFVQSLPLVGVSIGVARREPTPGAQWELVVGVIADPFKDEIFTACKGGGTLLNGAPVRVDSSELSDAVVATGFAPNERSLRPMVRGISAVGARARTVRMYAHAGLNSDLGPRPIITAT